MSLLPKLPLVDEEHRRLAATDLSEVYLVEAAAGTGKTTLLVSRILTIVRDTLTPLTRVVAITFTEKAAGDLKIKLREKLEEAARAEYEYAEQYRKALHDLDAMPVSTIHSFCRDLIAQRPVEAGVEPGFIVADEQTSRVLADEAWQAWIGEQFAADCPAARPFLERGMEVEGNGLTLRSLFDVLNDYRESLDALHVTRPDEVEVFAEIERFRAEIADHLKLGNVCRDAEDSLAKELANLQDWFEGSHWNGIDTAATTLLNRYQPSGARKGRKENWPPDVLDKLRAFFHGSYNARASDLISQLMNLQAAPLIDWLKEAVRYYNQLKSERSTLDFHDLLITARDMLKNSRAARDYFKARYDYLLVDEFQDTDPLQTEIIFFLAERADDSADMWEEVVLDSVKLFIVGDPKQSIYRFRRADLDLYGRVKEKIAERGKCLSIRMNFRSDPVIVGEVNALFENWMRGPSNGRYEPEYAAMEPARTSPGNDPTVVLLPPPPAVDLTENASRLAELEAGCVAEYIRELIASGRLIPRQDAPPRPVSFRDIGILYSATTHLAALENALRWREIPFQVAGGKNLPQRTEMRALRAVLSAIDNPYDAMSVVAALRSPFFACSDEELLAHHLDGGRFDYTGTASTIVQIQRSFEVLRELHEQSRRCAPSETLAALFDKTTGLQVYALKPQGESRAANLLKILDIARGLESAGSRSFHRLARWMERLEELRVGEEDSPIAESGDDVVQLMTFHKAKGLEFPVVLLYRLSVDQETRPSSILVDRAQKTVEFKGTGWQTSEFAATQSVEQDRQWHEGMRLLYVAMTRARDLLVVPAYWSKECAEDSQNRQWFLKLLQLRVPKSKESDRENAASRFVSHDTEKYSLETPSEEKLVIDLEADYSAAEAQQSRSAWAEWERKHTLLTASLERTGLFIKPSDHDETEFGSGEPSAHSGEQAKTFGSFIHEIFERIALPGGENADDVIESAAVEFSMGQTERDEARTLLERFLRSDLFTSRIGKSKRILREMPFVVPYDGSLVEGAMDLVFTENGTPVIVDFKSDRVSAETAALRAETYTHQAAAYVRALEQITGKTVAEVLLYFIRPDVVVSLPRERLLSEML
jgi:ATP-dependent helicase/nuclease subunit A